MVVRAVLSSMVLAGVALVPKWQQVYRGPDSDFIKAYQEVVRDSSEWHDQWATTGGSSATGNAKKLAPRINFTRKMVIVAASPGFAGDSVVLAWEPNAKTTGMFLVTTYHFCKSKTKTMPVDIIAVPADPGSVLFHDKEVRGPACPAVAAPAAKS
jgi:hypothetical protein